MRILLCSLIALCVVSYSCGDINTSDGDQTLSTTYEPVEAFPELSFENPTDLQHAGDDSDRIFVVEQNGMIKVFPNDSTVESATTFLNIQDAVASEGNEEGLLGLAFHPEYESNGYFYVNYTANNPDRTVICRFKVSPDDPNKAIRESETLIMKYEQPYANHNGGQLAFGPDGYLYIAAGDGGSSGDPQGNGQNTSTVLGSILRIDVDGMAHGRNYAIPPDNPFVDSEDKRGEIFAYGFRNPWRFSFDPETDWLWAGDVGQNQYEEIDIVEKGGNYGWNVMEGTHCYKSENCDQSGLEMPVAEYDHSGGNRSVTGGYVYRGSSLSELNGKYIYGDFASGKIWALDASNPGSASSTEIAQTDFPIASFGTDQDNELYLCGFDGKIYRLQPQADGE